MSDGRETLQPNSCWQALLFDVGGVLASQRVERPDAMRGAIHARLSVAAIHFRLASDLGGKRTKLGIARL